jgi:hypothetical protein
METDRRISIKDYRRLGGKRRLAGAAGLEPVTSAVTGQRSNQLSYAPAMEPVRLKEASGSVKRL